MAWTRFAMFAAALMIGAVPASSHSAEWRPGASQLLGIGHCAKGPCMRRASFLPNVPHRHMSKGVCVGKGAGGYRLGEVFPC